MTTLMMDGAGVVEAAEDGSIEVNRSCLIFKFLLPCITLKVIRFVEIQWIKYYKIKQ